MTKAELDKWLSGSAWDRAYWREVAIRAKRINSDGCTGVIDLFVWTCLEHDCFYRTHRFLDGNPITFEQANYVFRVRIQQTKTTWNPLTWIKYPVSWVRWAGVTVFGKRAWEGTA